MVQMFDHRAADVVVNPANLHRAAQPESLSSTDKQDSSRSPIPQYWVDEADCPPMPHEWSLAFKEITAPTNVRTMIAAVMPRAAFGNKLPLLQFVDVPAGPAARSAALLGANLNAMCLDFVLRRKLQGQTINWFILEQLPVVPPARFDDPLHARFTQHLRDAGLMNGHHPAPTIADFVLPQVLALSYTAHDLAPFARDLGYVDDQGQVLPPIRWDDEDRRRRLAALDALFFWLYGLGLDDAGYVMDSFPIVRQQDEAAFGRYRTKDEVLALLKLLPPPAG
jgi:hypothetical protein